MMKEKSKNAAKTRREKEKVEFQELARLLPLPDSISGQLDKASVIRLATAFLRLRRLLSENESPTSPVTQSPMSRGFMHQTSLPQSQFHSSSKSLTDASNTGFIQPKQPASTPPPCSTPFVDPTDGGQSTGKFNGSWQAGQQLAQALDGFLLVVGADGKLIYVSEAASLHLGLSQVEMTGQPVGEYLHQDDHTELISLINYYKSQLLSSHPQQDFRIPVSVVLRMKCVLAKRNAGIVHGGMKVIHCVGYIRSIPPAPPAPPPSMNSNNGWQHAGMYNGMPGVMGGASPSPPNNGIPLSLGNGIFIEDRTNDEERRTSSSAGSGGARVPSPHLPPCQSPPLPSFAPFALYLVGASVPPASATELRLASSSLFMLRTTLDMKLLFVETPRVTELLGYEPQDLIEKNLYNLIHCDDLRTFRANHQLLLIKGQCVTSYYRVLTRDGGWVWVQSVQTIVSNSRSSRPHCIVSVNHVISQDQQIFASSPYPPASFLPRRSSNRHSSSNSIPDACSAAAMAGITRESQLMNSIGHHQLLVPAPRAPSTLIKPSPVTALSAFHMQPGLMDSSSVSGLRTGHLSGFSSKLDSDDSSSRSLVPTSNGWPQRSLQPSSVPTHNSGFAEPSPFHNSRATYQNYHMGGFMPTSNGSGDFFSTDYSFLSKSSGMSMAGMESYERLFGQQQSDFSPATPMPMTPMTPSLLNTPAPTPGRFGETNNGSSTSSCQGNSASNGQNNSLQLVGGIHAHTINYTLHIENFNAHASANASSGVANKTQSVEASSLTSLDHHQSSNKKQNGSMSTSESVASAVASATAGLVLGAAPTTIVMCNNNGNNNGGNAQDTSSSCWFNEQQMGYSNASSTWQNNQLQSRNNNLSSSNVVQQPVMKTGHHPSAAQLSSMAAGMKRPFNGTSNYSAGSPFSSPSHHYLSHQPLSGVTSVIAMAPQSSSGVIEPLAKRITTAPTQSAWLNTIQQQP